MSDQTEDPMGGAPYGAMIEALRDFLDNLAVAKPDEATSAALGRDLRSWSQRLAPLAVDETQQIFGHRRDLAGRGQTMSPAYVERHRDEHSVRATVTFGRYFRGSGGAVHGGAIPLLLDEVLGRLANSGDKPFARTAYLNTNYRALTPVDQELALSAWTVSEDGRKLILRAELRHGDTLCADAEGLFVIVRGGRDQSKVAPASGAG